MEVFIPNTKKQYSISDSGVIYSNYRHQNNGYKTIRKRVVSKYKSTQTHTSYLVALSLNKGTKVKTYCVNSLMVRLFNIKVPDKYHYYDIICKDGNYSNSDIGNIGFKIRMEKDSNYPFYPQPYYNNKNRITHKICGECGNKKTIKHFTNASGGKTDNHKTYRNICEQCRSLKQWNAIRANIERLERHKINQNNWNNTEKGKAYWRGKRRRQHKYDSEHFTPHYISSILKFSEFGLTQKDVTSELRNIVKKRILLNRKIKQLKTQQNEKSKN